MSGAPLGTHTAGLEADYTYDGDGNVTSVQYPWNQWTNGDMTAGGMKYSMGFDSLGRLSGMQMSGDQNLVNSVQLWGCGPGAANETPGLSPRRAVTT